MKTLKQLIQELNWFDFLRKIKEILFKVSDNPLSSKIQAGDNITLEGQGTEESPLKINTAGGGSGGSQDLQSVLSEGTTANIDEFFKITNSQDIHLQSGSNQFQVNSEDATYGLDFTGKDYLLNSIGNGQLFTNTLGIHLEGQTKDIFIEASPGSIKATAQGNILTLEQGKIFLESTLGVNIVNTPNTDNSVTKGLARDTDGDIVQFDLVSETTPITIIEDTTVALASTSSEKYYGLKSIGTLASLPSISGSEGKKFIIANKSGGIVSVFSNDSTSLDILNQGNTTNELILTIGKVAKIFNDGENWIVTSIY